MSKYETYIALPLAFTAVIGNESTYSIAEYMYLAQSPAKSIRGLLRNTIPIAEMAIAAILLVSAQVTGYTTSKLVTGATTDTSSKVLMHTGIVKTVAESEVIIVPINQREKPVLILNKLNNNSL